MSILPDQLRIAMRRWATGVAIVSSAHEGKAHGMTVSSFTSLSLDPPYVLVSLGRMTRTHDLVIHSGIFGVTILAEDQTGISNNFANAQTELGGRFEGIETFHLVSGVPLIRGALAWFDCTVVKTIDAGTHSVIIGEVVAVEEGDDGPPLMYFNQGFRKLT